MNECGNRLLSWVNCCILFIYFFGLDLTNYVSLAGVAQLNPTQSELFSLKAV